MGAATSSVCWLRLSETMKTDGSAKIHLSPWSELVFSWKPLRSERKPALVFRQLLRGEIKKTKTHKLREDQEKAFGAVRGGF